MGSRQSCSQFQEAWNKLRRSNAVFNDPLAYTIEDERNSEMETREVIIGHSANHRLLLVAFTERNEELVRIFSARQATRKERRDYEKGSKY